LSDYSYSKDVSEELRMIHRFLRESNQLKFKFTPNYARFKWMGKNIFRYVGLDRIIAQVAESLTQELLITTERAAVLRLYDRCVGELREDHRVRVERKKMKQHIYQELINEVSAQKMTQYVENVCLARCKSIQNDCYANQI
jgi:hypothetical protein